MWNILLVDCSKKARNVESARTLQDDLDSQHATTKGRATVVSAV